MPASGTRQRRLRWIITGSLGLAIRDLWLAARGGGITPRRLLAAEIISLGGCAFSAIVELRDGATALRRSTALFGYTGLAIHGTRMVIYLSRRKSPARA
jgi:hypothetical protein